MSKIFAIVSRFTAEAAAARREDAMERTARFQLIFEQPDDLARRRVLADWLLERGDPRGEFISLQFDASRKARLRASKLLHRFRSQFLGPLARWVDDHRDEVWEHGFLSRAVVRLAWPLAAEPSLATLRWARVPSADPVVFASPWLKGLHVLEVPTSLHEAALVTGATVRLARPS